jgi:hypothetical protein
MQRRSFLKSAGAAIAVAPAFLSMEGCSKSQLIAWINDVDAEVKLIGGQLGQVPLAALLDKYLQQLDAAVQAWNGSSWSAAVISISGDLQVALGDTTIPAPVVAAADTAINLLDTVIAFLAATLKSTAVAPVAPPPAAAAHGVSAEGGRLLTTTRPHRTFVFKTLAQSRAAWAATGMPPLK